MYVCLSRERYCLNPVREFWEEVLPFPPAARPTRAPGRRGRIQGYSLGPRAPRSLHPARSPLKIEKCLSPAVPFFLSSTADWLRSFVRYYGKAPASEPSCGPAASPPASGPQPSSLEPLPLSSSSLPFSHPPRSLFSLFVFQTRESRRVSRPALRGPRPSPARFTSTSLRRRKRPAGPALCVLWRGARARSALRAQVLAELWLAGGPWGLQVSVGAALEALQPADCV